MDEHDFTGRTSGSELKTLQGILQNPLAAKLNSISSEAGRGELLYKKTTTFLLKILPVVWLNTSKMESASTVTL